MYHMRRSLFLDIIHKLGECSPYFTKGFDARLLAYDMTANTIYGYLKLGKTTILECLEKYYEGIIDCYGFDLLHQPTVAHWYACASSNRRAYISWYVREHRLYALAVDELSSALAGPIYNGNIKHPTIILEVIASKDRWI
jgi:hypothetical protein